MSVREYWGNSDAVFQCLIDRKRIRAFQKAIEYAVSDNSIVADLGSGSGILSMFAIRAGAKKVFAVEQDPEMCKLIEKTKFMNSMDERLVVINSDARTVKLPCKVDVVICEMIATGLIDEMQVPVINHIHNFCKKHTTFIPQSISSFVELVNSNDVFYKEKLFVVRYDYVEENSLRALPLSEKKCFSEVDFRNKIHDRVSIDLRFKIHKSGLMNGIKISNESLLPNNKIFETSFAYCMPIILPIDEMLVEKGDIIILSLNYKMCTGIQRVKYRIKRLR